MSKSRFGTRPRDFFASVYQDVAPWDIGGPQADMVALFKEIPPAGPVLDVGCGSGDLALFLAQTGLDVVGVDFVDEAIQQARAKADALLSSLKGSIDFVVADATRPSLLGRAFGAIVDSGFFHVLTPEQGDEYVFEVARALRIGGRFYMHEFATEFDVPNTPRRITEEEIRTRFTAASGWQLQSLRSGEFLSRVAPVPAILACAERVASLT